MLLAGFLGKRDKEKMLDTCLRGGKAKGIRNTSLGHGLKQALYSMRAIYLRMYLGAMQSREGYKA